MNRRALLLGGACLTAMPHVSDAMGIDPVGLIFIGQASCPYCRAVSPIFYDLRAKGMSVLSVSMDHAPIPPFDTYEDGTEHPLSSGVSTVPLVYVYHAGLGRITHEIAGVRNLRTYLARLARAMADARAMS